MRTGYAANQGAVESRRIKMPIWEYEHIRDHYGIAIKKGMHIQDGDGNRGVIVGASNHVKVRMEGAKINSYYHPEALSYPAIGYVGKEIKEKLEARGER